MKSAGKERASNRQRRRIHALVCAQAVNGEFQPRRAEASCAGARLSVSLLPCTSKLEAGDLLALLEQGADGILVVGCRPPSCRFQVGSARAARRVGYAQRLLEEIGLGAWRLRIELGGARSEADLADLAEQYARSIAGQPPNPVRALHDQG